MVSLLSVLLIKYIVCLKRNCHCVVCYHCEHQHRAEEAGRTEVSEELKREIIDKHVKDNGYEIISMQFHVPVTRVAKVIKKSKVHGTVANLQDGST